MYKISYEPCGGNNLMSARTENTNVKNNSIEKGIVSISSSGYEKKTLKKLISDICNSMNLRLNNSYSKNESILPLTDMQFKYTGQSLQQQSEDISAQLQDRLVPTFSSPFTLKGKMGLCLGAGLLSNITSCTHYSHPGIKTSHDISLPRELSGSTIGEYSDAYSMEHSSPQKCRSVTIDSSDKHSVKNNFGGIISFCEQNNSQHLVDFLRKAGILSHDLSSGDLKKEVLVSAVAKYLYDHSLSTPDQKKNRHNDVAISILKDNDLYEPGQEKVINENMTELIISYWLFHAVLNMSPEQYITNKMSSSRYPEYFTVGSIRALLGLNDLFKSNLLSYQDIPSENWGEFNAMWYYYLGHEIPILKYPRSAVDGISLSSQEFSELNAGSGILSGDRYSTGYTLSEVIQRG